MIILFYKFAEPDQKNNFDLCKTGVKFHFQTFS